MSTPAGAIWRACAGCGIFAAMSAAVRLCPAYAAANLLVLLTTARRQVLDAVAGRDGTAVVAVLARLRRDTSPVLADQLLRGMVTGGYLTTGRLATGGGR